MAGTTGGGGDWSRNVLGIVGSFAAGFVRTVLRLAALPAAGLRRSTLRFGLGAARGGGGGGGEI